MKSGVNIQLNDENLKVVKVFGRVSKLYSKIKAQEENKPRAEKDAEWAQEYFKKLFAEDSSKPVKYLEIPQKPYTSGLGRKK